MGKRHKHVMVYGPVAGQSWFWCELCPASVEIVPMMRPSAEGTKLIASARVRNAGACGFDWEELLTLARLWHAMFAAYVAEELHRERSVPRRRRRRARVAAA